MVSSGSDGLEMVVSMFWMASTDEHDTASVGVVWWLSEEELEGVLIVVVPAGEHDTAPTGLDSMVLGELGSEHTGLTAEDRLGNGASA